MTFKTAFKSLVASTAIFGLFLAPAFALAQEVTPIVQTEASIAVDMTTELADLKARESDPTAGFVTRFFLRIKIKELENKLNIATAFK